MHRFQRKARESNPHLRAENRLSRAARLTVSGYLPSPLGEVVAMTRRRVELLARASSGRRSRTFVACFKGRKPTISRSPKSRGALGRLTAPTCSGRGGSRTLKACARPFSRRLPSPQLARPSMPLCSGPGGARILVCGSSGRRYSISATDPTMKGEVSRACVRAVLPEAHSLHIG